MARADPKLVLLVEDNEDDVLLFKRALKKAGLLNPVHVAFDIATARQYLNGEGPFTDRAIHPFPAILVIDLRLPDGSGLDFLRWVRSHPEFRVLHCLVATGDDRTTLFQDCYDAGADSFLRKPCSHQELANIAAGFPHHWAPRPASNLG